MAEVSTSFGHVFQLLNRWMRGRIAIGFSSEFSAHLSTNLLDSFRGAFRVHHYVRFEGSC